MVVAAVLLLLLLLLAVFLVLLLCLVVVPAVRVALFVLLFLVDTHEKAVVDQVGRNQKLHTNNNTG